jgi:AraC-like DNA-binding protein
MNSGEKITRLRKAEFFRSELPFAVNVCCHTKEEFPVGNTCFIREFWKITCILEGNATLRYYDDSCPLRPGSIYLVHPGCPTTYIIGDSPLKLVNVLFTGDVLEELVQTGEMQPEMQLLQQRMKRHELPMFHPRSSHAEQNIINEICREYREKQPYFHAIIKSGILRLMTALFRLERHSRNADPLGAIRKIIHRDFITGVALDDMAAQLKVTKQHLCHLYHQKTGRTIIADVNDLRLDHALTLLMQTNMDVAQIAAKSGFRDVSYFYRAFKKRFGQKPGDFRNDRK